MSIKKYYHDSYRTDYTAKILEVLEENERILVVTDETIFYPEGGGQPADCGTINDIEVLDVQERDGVIYHMLSEKPVGSFAQMKIDWDRRYDLMQQHTGEHLVSGLFLKLLGGNNKGFHLGADFVTIDIDIPKLGWEQLMIVENAANQKISENVLIQETLTDLAGLAEFPIRKQISAEGELRVVTIEDVDCCACCGTHVRSLAEVGMVKILKTEQYKGMTRIHLVCGKRAQQDYVQRFEITRELKRLLNADEERIVERTVHQKEEIDRLKKNLYEQKKLLAGLVAEACVQEKENQLTKEAKEHNVQGAGSERYREEKDIVEDDRKIRAEETKSADNTQAGNSEMPIDNKPADIKEGNCQAEDKQKGGGLFKIFDDYDAELLSMLEGHLVQYFDTIVLGSGVDKKVLAFTKVDVDMGAIFKENLAKFSGRGGGKGARAQAMFAEEESLRAFVDMIKNLLQ